MQWVDAVVGKEQTPLLYEKFCKWLFVGFAHNLLLECMVSRLTMLEKRHPHQHALKLNAVFKYHMKQEPGRKARAALRSETHGARSQASKEAVLEGKLLKKSRGNMRQQLALAVDMCKEASELSDARLRTRGKNSVSEIVQATRDAYDAKRGKVRDLACTLHLPHTPLTGTHPHTALCEPQMRADLVSTLRRTNTVTARGNSRAPALTLQACQAHPARWHLRCVCMCAPSALS